MQLTRVRVRASGQVVDMVPSVATAMILGGTAEQLDSDGNVVARTESMTVPAGVERAVTPQAVVPRPKIRPRGR
jgi:hypothetical protein